MRLLRTLLVFKLGVYAGVAAAAAVVKRALPSQGDASSDELALVAIFDGVELESRATAFRGGSMLTWFGGIDVDLREAQLAQDAQLSVTALLGGIAIRIPEGWRVESNVKALAGGVDVKTIGADDPGAPTLRIDGLAALGGIAVGAKPRFAETET
ncbi:MAG TPA: LiaF domain-containing protein [Gaiellaceae bacterium]|nr:LiaF domain-containing protein [Gaiellaceae bacterium]